MQLSTPFFISSRLLPAIKIADGVISLEPVKRAGPHIRWRWYIDLPEGEFSEADMRTSWGTQRAFESLLGFLSACAESYRYKMSFPDSEPENLDPFPPEVAEWAYINSDEISMLCCELEEVSGLIEE